MSSTTRAGRSGSCGTACGEGRALSTVARTDAPEDPRDRLVLSYLGLRRVVGVLGMALPFVLVAGKLLIDGPGLEPTISDYYYTSMRNVFVGTLCAIAVFLLSYRYARADAVAGGLGGVFALGVAIFPTTERALPLGRIEPVGLVHVLSAVGFFLTLAYFCLVLFPRTRRDVPPTRNKRRRNAVYRASGWLILACVVLAGVAVVTPDDALERAVHPVFWLEALADVAFGVAWFVKGETILTD